MFAFKIWHIGHYSSEEWFGHHDTQVLGDIMTDDTYRDDDEKEEKRENKDEKKDDKKKSVAFKATSSKGKAKQETSSEEDDSWNNDDDEKMALFIKRFGKFMVKKGYHARRKEVFIQEQGRVKKVLQVWKQGSSCCSMPIQ